MAQKIIVGITQGDTNGIGYEVIIKALSDARILDLCTPVVYGSSRAFGFYRKQIPETDNINTNIINAAKDAHPKRVNIINCVSDNMSIDPGQCTHEGARSAIVALEAAVKDLKEGSIDVLVTAPFNKRAVSDETFSFPGHTEYLVKEFGAQDGLMFLCSDKIRVGVATNHLPISKVPGALTEDLILSKLRLMNQSLLRDFNIVKPKLAVLGLNPHSGDRGLLGEEEIGVISPAIKKANEEGILAFGPYPPDGFFSINMQYKFDAVLAMYHDQGLIPFKSLAFDSGVNYTAGLPVVRTSPDHGTAYDLAGENRANPMSMMSAIYMALDIYRNRKLYDDMRASAMKSREADCREKPEPKNTFRPERDPEEKEDGSLHEETAGKSVKSSGKEMNGSRRINGNGAPAAGTEAAGGGEVPAAESAEKSEKGRRAERKENAGKSEKESRKKTPAIVIQTPQEPEPVPAEQAS